MKINEIFDMKFNTNYRTIKLSSEDSIVELAVVMANSKIISINAISLIEDDGFVSSEVTIAKIKDWDFEISNKYFEVSENNKTSEVKYAVIKNFIEQKAMFYKEKDIWFADNCYDFVVVIANEYDIKTYNSIDEAKAEFAKENNIPVRKIGVRINGCEEDDLL